MSLVTAPTIDLLRRLFDIKNMMKTKNNPYSREVLDNLDEEFKYFTYLQVIIEILPKDSNVKSLFTNVQKTNKVAPSLIESITLDNAILPYVTRPLHDQLDIILQKVTKMKLNDRDRAFVDKFSYVVKGLNKNQPFDKKVFAVVREAQSNLIVKSVQMLNRTENDIEN